ncbi:hypothetical protein [Bradyrhizobium sp. NAS80.1]|uniref:hypothetical protein n=1 Tax=Bradyrhizobium sp. NAS80.1 TaxID=1680159 RepID=UPI00143DDBF6|nr:hypothetical protein [Bradyrhizobium sp. NAS80.1]
MTNEMLDPAMGPVMLVGEKMIALSGLLALPKVKTPDAAENATLPPKTAVTPSVA